MAQGPLAVRWGDWTLDEPHAGALGRRPGRAREHRHGRRGATGSGSPTTGSTTADNPIVWDGERTTLPELAPGRDARPSRRTVRAPIPPGRYRFALDLVADHRAWFSELGSEPVAAEVEVLPRPGSPAAELPGWVEPAPGLGRARRRGARGGLRRRRRCDRLARRPRPAPSRRPGAVRARARPGPELPASAALPVGARRHRARAPAGRRRAAGVRGAGRRAVALRRADRADRARETPLRAVAPVVQSSIAIRSSIRLKTTSAERERDDGGDREVDHIGRPRGPAEPERVADGVDRRRDEVAPAQEVEQRLMPLRPRRKRGAGEAPEDRRQEEPRAAAPP